MREPSSTWEIPVPARVYEFGAFRLDASKRPYLVGVVHAWRREPALAFEWLQRAVDRRDPRMFMTAYDPLLRKVRDDPRYAPFLARLTSP
jgi:hypothetical protein